MCHHHRRHHRTVNRSVLSPPQPISLVLQLITPTTTTCRSPITSTTTLAHYPTHHHHHHRIVIRSVFSLPQPVCLVPHPTHHHHHHRIVDHVSPPQSVCLAHPTHHHHHPPPLRLPSEQIGPNNPLPAFFWSRVQGERTSERSSPPSPPLPSRLPSAPIHQSSRQTEGAEPCDRPVVSRVVTPHSTVLCVTRVTPSRLPSAPHPPILETDRGG
jgi:hypothetical protein